jgi:hypothetical protein
MGGQPKLASLIKLCTWSGVVNDTGFPPTQGFFELIFVALCSNVLLYVS